MANGTWADSAEVQFHIDESLASVVDAPAGSDEQVERCRDASDGLAAVFDANGTLLEGPPPNAALGDLQSTLVQEFSALLDSCFARDGDAVEVAVGSVQVAITELKSRLEAIEP